MGEPNVKRHMQAHVQGFVESLQCGHAEWLDAQGAEAVLRIGGRQFIIGFTYADETVETNEVHQSLTFSVTMSNPAGKTSSEYRRQEKEVKARIALWLFRAGMGPDPHTNKIYAY